MKVNRPIRPLMSMHRRGVSVDLPDGALAASHREGDAGDSSRPPRRLLSLACLIVAGAMIGISSNLASLAATAGLTPYAFLTWAVLGAALLHGGVAALRGTLATINRRTIKYFAISGLITLVAPYLINFAAVPKVGAGFVSLSIAFPPLFTYVIALSLKMERFRAVRAAGVALALSGAVLLAAFKFAEPDANVFWIASTLAVPLILAIGNIYRTRRWPGEAKPSQLAPGMLMASAIFLVAAGLLPGLSLAIPTDGVAPLLLILAQATTFSVLYVFFFLLQKVAGPVYLSLMGSVAAVFGAAIAIGLLGEAPPRGLFTAALLIALGIALVTRPGTTGEAGSHH
jgi:drug/metabolite transporter (DMT)-like permease